MQTASPSFDRTGLASQASNTQMVVERMRFQEAGTVLLCRNKAQFIDKQLGPKYTSPVSDTITDIYEDEFVGALPY